MIQSSTRQTVSHSVSDFTCKSWVPQATSIEEMLFRLAVHALSNFGQFTQIGKRSNHELRVLLSNSQEWQARNYFQQQIKAFNSCVYHWYLILIKYFPPYSNLFVGPTGYILKHPDHGFRPFAPHKWNHFCLSFNTKTDMIRVILVSCNMILIMNGLYQT